MSKMAVVLVLPSGARVRLGAQDRTEKPDPSVLPPPRPERAPEKAPATGTQQQPAGKGEPPQPPGDQCLQMLLLFVPFLLIMYFLMIRPQQKQEKERRAMLSSLKKGDHVVTSGGMHGQVVALDEHTVTIKFGSGEGQRAKFDRSAIARVVPKGGDKKDGA